MNDLQAGRISALLERRIGEAEAADLLRDAQQDPALLDALADALEMHRALETVYAPPRDAERDAGRILVYVRASGESTRFFASVQERARQRLPRRAAARRARAPLWRWVAAAAVAMAIIGYFILGSSPRAGEVVAVRGAGAVLLRGGRSLPVGRGAEIRPGDRIESGAPVELRLEGGAEIDLAAGSALGVFSGEIVRLEAGRLYAAVPSPRLVLSTPVAEVRVRGTRFELSAEGDRAELKMEEGRADFSTPAGTRSVEALQACAARRGSAPQLPVPIRLEGIWRGRRGGATARPLLGAGPAPAGIGFPRDAGVIDVRQAYGAKGDGAADDAPAIQRAIDENLSKFRVLYFRDGLYRLTRALTFGTDREKAKQIVLQGQSRDGTVLRLDDRAPGFDDPSRRRPLLAMFEGEDTSMAFGNSVRDMTLDVGRGNAGAAGVRWMASNVGVLENVTLRSSDPEGRGAVGLDLSGSEPGPCLFKNVTIEGFDIGIRAVAGRFGVAFEQVTLRGQRAAGLHNTGQALSIRGLEFRGKGPAVVQDDRAGMLFLVDASLAGEGRAAIDNRGMVHLRRVRQGGYGRLVDNAEGPGLEGTSVEEYVSHHGAAAGPGGSLGLPVEETPEIPWTPPDQWVGMDLASLREKEDDTAAIQAAFDRAEREGKSTVYFPGGLPPGTIRFGGTVRIPPGVCRVLGMDSTLGVTEGMLRSGRPLFIVRGDGAGPLVLERFTVVQWSGGDFAWVEHDSPRPLVLRHLNSYGSMTPYRGRPGCVLFVEDVCAAPWVFTKQRVWMRQIDVEWDGVAIENRGGDLWILGLHAEKAGATLVRTADGGRTEVFGGLNYPHRPSLPRKLPMFVVEEASASLSLGAFSGRDAGSYDVFLRETLGGVTRDLGVKDADAGGRGPWGAFPGIVSGGRR